jgi:hypothetical protein
MHDEDRDTIHPKMVTELFAAFLRSVGEPVEVSSLWKNTREEVMWEDSKFFFPFSFHCHLSVLVHGHSRSSFLRENPANSDILIKQC